MSELKHHGILGMKWGVRRARDSKTGLVKTSGSTDYKTSRELKKRGTKNLSTRELRDLTQRLQLEKQLKDLSPNQYKRGMNVVKGILAAGTTVASLYALTKTPLGQDIAKAFKSDMASKAMDIAYKKAMGG